MDKIDSEIEEFLNDRIDSPFSGDDIQRIISEWGDISKYFTDDRRGLSVAVLAEVEGWGYDNLAIQGVLVLANEYEKMRAAEWFRTFRLSGIHQNHSAEHPNELCDYCQNKGWVK